MIYKKLIGEMAEWSNALASPAEGGSAFGGKAIYNMGELAEWSNASASKADVLKGTEGSNPSLSAPDPPYF